MDFNKAIEDIKKVLFNTVPVAPVAPAPVEPTPVELGTEYVLADGTVVSIDKLEAGGVVLIEGVPAPDGEHELQDGTKITVAGGIIESVQAKEVEPVEPEDMNKQFAEDIASLKNEFTSHKEAFASVQADFTAAKETIGKQDAAINQLLEVVQKLSEVAVSQPAQAPQNFEKNVEDMTPLERHRYFKQL